MEFFVPDPGDSPQLPLDRVVRQLHSACGSNQFRRVPPDRDASELEVGLDEDGKTYFIREPMGGNTNVTRWSPAAGNVACKRCWRGERMDNEIFNFAMKKTETE